ncbi:MAG TPA: ankyrin repeat domain-containing protein [Phycisphaerales bacterium]|nr:ankyrin repeat domain-containing protein [Phycisphaerales bacterium]
MPRGMYMADIGPYLTLTAYDNIRHAVEKTNERINRAKESNPSSSEIERLKSGETIAAAVRSEFPNAMFIIDDLDANSRSDRMFRDYPGKITGYKDFACIYEHSSFILDPRQFFKLFRAGTIHVADRYIGADKIGHFLDKGYLCFERYNSAVKKSGKEEDGINAILTFGTGDDFIFSERGMLGRMSSGAYSNGDLCADFMGFTFYRNLYEPMKVQGKLRDPMLKHDGDLWALADYVQPDSTFFTDLFSTHMDEALNPCYYESAMRDAVRQAVKNRSESVLDWYRDENNQRRSSKWFENIRHELQTLWGQNYGYAGKEDEIVSIDKTCFVEPDKNAPPIDRLLWAASTNNTGQINELIRTGLNPGTQDSNPRNMPADPGDTALHVAARCNNLEAVQALIAAHADVNIANSRGVTPLHAGSNSQQITEALLNAAASVNAPDDQGRTALHYAARYNNASVIALLLAHGANSSSQDFRNRTPLHDAAQAGAIDAVSSLATVSNVNARSFLGMTPLHLAADLKDPAATLTLLDDGADPSVTDSFGWTPLHAAAAAGSAQVESALLDHGADVNAADDDGETPLHLAARRDHPNALKLLISRGADLNAAANFKSTPLHEAAFSGRPEVVSILLDAGADREALDENRHDALDVAHQKNQSEVIALLRSMPQGSIP